MPPSSLMNALRTSTNSAEDKIGLIDPRLLESMSFLRRSGRRNKKQAVVRS